MIPAYGGAMHRRRTHLRRAALVAATTVAALVLLAEPALAQAASDDADPARQVGRLIGVLGTPALIAWGIWRLTRSRRGDG